LGTSQTWSNSRKGWVNENSSVQVLFLQILLVCSDLQLTLFYVFSNSEYISDKSGKSIMVGYFLRLRKAG